MKKLLAFRQMAMLVSMDKNYGKSYPEKIDVSKIPVGIKNRGLNTFYYGNNVIYAINKKNADKKAKKKGYI